MLKKLVELIEGLAQTSHDERYTIVYEMDVLKEWFVASTGW